jgi:hypothetical protein
MAAKTLHSRFLALLPRIQTHALIVFRDIACPQRRADLIAELIALAWLWFIRLAKRGKAVEDFVVTFCRLLTKAVKSGRKLAGMVKAKDVLNRHAQQRHGFKVQSLPLSTRACHEDLYSAVRGQQLHDTYEERLKDNTVTPPPDAAAFRIDFPIFLSSLSQRDRELAEFLSLGNSGKHAASKFGISQGRVTQLRQTWCRVWRSCQGEEGSTSPKSSR